MAYVTRCYIIIVGCCLLLGGSALAQSDGFRASSVKIDITPDSSKWLQGYAPRKSEGVHDRLFHRIVALDDGVTQFFLISTDVAVISPSFYQRMVSELEKRTDIQAEQVWWTTTHTHSAPQLGPPGLVKLMLPDRYEKKVYPNPRYSEWVLQLLVDGIIDAQESLEPAQLGIGTGKSWANINRRAEDVDGSISLGMNPDRPVDRQINLLRLEQPDGSPIALVGNYAIHGTALGGNNLQISGDVPGVVAEYVEDKTGAPMLFINGAVGNVAPIYSGFPNPEGAHLSQFKVLLGNKILAANRSITTTTSDVTLSIDETVVETPRKEGFGWIDELDAYRRITSMGAAMVRLPIYFLRINDDAIIWSTPGELFSQTAMTVRERSPFRYTFFYGLTNGTLLYIPTRRAFEEGGYEAGAVTPYTPEVEQDLTTTVTSYLHELFHERRSNSERK